MPVLLTGYRVTLAFGDSSRVVFIHATRHQDVGGERCFYLGNRPIATVAVQHITRQIEGVQRPVEEVTE